MTTADDVTPLHACRLCGEPELLELALDLGPMVVSGFPEPGSFMDTQVVAPLELVTCRSCRLVQLAHTVHPRPLFQGDYWYASGINGTMREELRNVVREARGWVRINDGDWVLDIGANDGTLLRSWHEHAWEGRPYRFAVEPADTFQKMLADTCEVVVQDLFPCDALQGAGKFKVITSVAMFYAVPNPVQFATAIRELLAPDGVWVVQMQDLRNMVRQTAFDNICHEHLTYYDVQSFYEVCQRAGLTILSYSPREINGGSLRFIVKRCDRPTTCPPVPRADEGAVDWPAFEARMDDRLARLQDTVAAALDHGHLIDLLGASTKGNTLLQLAALGPAQIRRCWERHPGKIGRYTVTGVPIVHEDTGRGGENGLGASPGDQAPGLLVCPIWQFRGGLIEREYKYLQAGGRIYFPLPEGELFQYVPGELQ